MSDSVDRMLEKLPYLQGKRPMPEMEFGERVIYTNAGVHYAGITMTAHPLLPELAPDKVRLMVLGALGADGPTMGFGFRQGSMIAVGRDQCTFGDEAIAFHVLLKMQGAVLDVD